MRICKESPRLVSVSAVVVALEPELHDSRQVARLRKANQPLLDLYQEVFQIQLANRDDALAEIPLVSKSTHSVY